MKAVEKMTFHKKIWESTSYGCAHGVQLIRKFKIQIENRNPVWDDLLSLYQENE